MIDTYEYDKTTGVVRNRLTGQKVGSNEPHGSFLSRRLKGKVKKLNLSILAWILSHKAFPKGDVRYKDGNQHNLKYTNLCVAKKGKKFPSMVKKVPCWVETDEFRIFYSDMKKLWCVRRGKDQSVYLATSREEADSVLKQWKSNMKLCIPDKFTKY